MSPILALPLLAGIGLLYAGLWAVYVHTLNGKRPLVAAIADAVVTTISFAAWAIMARTGRENDVLGIIVYAMGGAVGTYIVLRMKMRRAEMEQKALAQKQESQLALIKAPIEQ